MSGTFTNDEKIQYALKTALFRTMQTEAYASASEMAAPPRIFPQNIMKVNIIEKGLGDIDENGYYVGGSSDSVYVANQIVPMDAPELTVQNYKIIDPSSNKITNVRINDLASSHSNKTMAQINALPTTGTTYPLQNWFFRGHYGGGTNETAFNNAGSAYHGLQLAWDKSTTGTTAAESDIVPHLKYYLQVQTKYTDVKDQGGDNLSYTHAAMVGLIGLDQNFTNTIKVNKGEGHTDKAGTLGSSGTSDGDFWFTQATAGLLSFYGVSGKVNETNALDNLNTTLFPMISFVRYTGETGFGAGSGGGGGGAAANPIQGVTSEPSWSSGTITTQGLGSEMTTSLVKGDADFVGAILHNLMIYREGSFNDNIDELLEEILGSNWPLYTGPAQTFNNDKNFLRVLPRWNNETPNQFASPHFPYHANHWTNSHHTRVYSVYMKAKADVDFFIHHTNFQHFNDASAPKQRHCAVVCDLWNDSFTSVAFHSSNRGNPVSGNPVSWHHSASQGIPLKSGKIYKLYIISYFRNYNYYEGSGYQFAWQTSPQATPSDSLTTGNNYGSIQTTDVNGISTWYATMRENDKIEWYSYLKTPVVDVSGNVGIGTTSPVSALTIGGTTTTLSDTILTLASDGGSLYKQGIKMIHHGGAPNGGTDATQYGWYMFGSDVTDKLHIGSYNGSSTESDHLVITRSDGNVGIGTTSPQGQLSLYQSGDNGGELWFGNSNINGSTSKNYGKISFNTYLGGGVPYRHIGHIRCIPYGSNYGGDIIFNTYNDIYGGGDRMVIRGNGNVGIGTTSPGEKLCVNGSIMIKGSSNSTTTNDSKLIFTRDLSDSDESDFIARIYTGNYSGPLILEASRGSGHVQTISNRAGTDPLFVVNRINDGNKFTVTGNGRIYIECSDQYIQSWNRPGHSHWWTHIEGSYFTFHRNGIGHCGKFYAVGNSRALVFNEAVNNNYTQYYSNYANWNATLLVGAGPMGAGNNNWTASNACVFVTNGNLHLDNKNGYTTYINNYSSGNIILCNSGGNVGIDCNPTNGKFEVSGYVNKYMWARYYNSGGGNQTTTATRPLSAYFSDHISCHELQVKSDRRIKKNIVDISDNQALSMLRDIPCRYYEYCDTISKGNGKTIGFIAQEVKEIMPMAVSFVTEMIPNEMRRLENISWNEIIDASDNKTYKLKTDLQDVSGIKYRFFVSNDISGNDECKKDIIGNQDNTFTFKKKWNYIFCYGKEVDDFHTLDKQKLFALNFSATQELDRKVTTLENENAKLKIKNTELENKVVTLESQLAVIKQHLGI